ncbi:hypothetical protein [Demequina sp.]|uniref:hypothetical protein n=1 Tax=Demequina sp. TaxID=2050685 RepID=UPI003A8A26F0
MRCIHWFAGEMGAPVQFIRRNMRTIPHHKRGRLVRFTEGDADEYEAATKVEAEPEIALTSLSRARQAARGRRP